MANEDNVDHVARAELFLSKLNGDLLSRLDALATELLARGTVAEASGDADAAMLWRDAAEGVLPVLDFLVAREREGAAQRR